MAKNIKNANKAIYVYLFKRPNGINAGDVTVSSNLSESLGGTNYIKAVYNPSDPTSVNQYFSLPRTKILMGSILLYMEEG